jgi:hypothetical protein
VVFIFSILGVSCFDLNLRLRLDGRVGWGPKSKAKIADKDASTTSADTTEIPEPNGVSEKEDSLDVDPGLAEPNGKTEHPVIDQ